MTRSIAGVIVVAAVTAALIGCEARAQRENAIAEGRLSAVYESCGSTAECEEPLRCVEAACRRLERSTVGDYHVAAGALALSKGEVESALAAYRDAERQYKNEKIDVPPEVSCAFGAALVQVRSDPLKAEEAAAKLHRCLNGVPSGSALRERALTSLAELGDAGFDPVHIGSAEIADRYMTRAPSAPDSSRLKVAASAERTSNKKTFGQWMDMLGSAEIAAALAPCWTAYFEATKKRQMVVTLPWRYSFYLDEDDESRDRGILKVAKYPAPSGEGAAAAHDCVAGKLGPIATKMARRGGEHSWSSKITITVAP